MWCFLHLQNLWSTIWEYKIEKRLNIHLFAGEFLHLTCPSIGKGERVIIHSSQLGTYYVIVKYTLYIIKNELSIRVNAFKIENILNNLSKKDKRY